MGIMMGPLTKLLVHAVEGAQPEIVTLKEPIRIVGMTVDTDLRHIYRDVPGLGKRLQEYKQTHTIPHKQEPWAFACVTKGYDKEKGTLSYTMGDVVTGPAEQLEGLISLEIPAITYAIFPVRPKNRFGWPFAIADTKRYAYTVWLPQSGYEPAGVIDDFEYHDERGARKHDPQVDLYVAIKPKLKG